MREPPYLPLSGVLSIVAAATSLATALKLAEATGGIRVYIPARPEAGHWLSGLVGHAQALAIGEALAAREMAGHVLVPMGPSVSERKRWLRIQHLIDGGSHKRQIAQACGVHERTIQRHRNGGVKTANAILAQSDLFDA